MTNLDNWKVIAHRGASNEAPENTLTSIKRALSLKVDFVEMDIHITRDQVPIVIHDHSFLRTTNALFSTTVSDSLYKDVTKLNAGSWFSPSYPFEKVPTLYEALALPKTNARWMIELKDDGGKHEALSEVVKDAIDRRSDILVASFSMDILSFFPNHPKMALAYTEEGIEKALKAGHPHLGINHFLLNHERICELLSLKKRIWTYTVDCPKRAIELVLAGVEGVITNHPREFLYLKNGKR